MTDSPPFSPIIDEAMEKKNMHTMDRWRFHDMEGNTLVAGRPGIAIADFNARNRSADENNANARLCMRLVNLHNAGLAREAAHDASIRARGDLPPDSGYGLSENEIAAARIMNGVRAEYETLLAAAMAARSALDGLMGDTDSDDDDSPAFHAMQMLSAAIPDEEER